MPHTPAATWSRRALASALLVLGAAVAAQPSAPPPTAAVGAEWSPGVAWEPYGPHTRAVGLRRLSAAEARLAQQRAAGLHAAFRASPSFAQPRDRAHLVTSHAGIEAPSASHRAQAPTLQQSVIAYWSQPRDVRRRADGVLTPVLGGAHELVYFETNLVPRADQLVDRSTAGDFTRGVVEGRHGGFFAQPRVLGQLGGGTVYADLIVFTRDGRSALAPAPIGELLDLEIARLEAIVAELERGAAERLREAEASLSPEQVAARRARREQVWSRETRDPAVLAQRLDAAHRSDVADAERTRRDFSMPAVPDPSHRLWAPRLALEAARQRAASLDAAGRGQPGCGRVEPGFSGGYAVRFDVLGAAQPCVPMVQVRADLLDPGRPLEDVQLLTVLFRGSSCGEVIGGVRALPSAGRCHYGVPLLRELDWALLCRSLGWQ
jgi:hypothetical protein